MNYLINADACMHKTKISQFQLLRNSQAHNAKLKIELKALESMLESAKFQLKSTQDRVREENADYEEDKKEDAAAAKKLAEIEEELKVGDLMTQNDKILTNL